MKEWHNIHNLEIEGKGWQDTAKYFDRLPARAESSVPEPVWNLSRSATGMAVLFETDASEIHARWELESEMIHEPNFPAAAFSGLDLYAWTGKVWRWVGAGHLITSRSHEQPLVEGMKAGNRRYLLYLPLRNPVLKVEIGIPEGSTFHPVPPRKAKPLAFYGTSIVHGAYASHAGMVHPSILGRWLNRPVINLGFSGNGRMEPEVAALLGELRAQAYVLDCVPNMDASEIHSRAENFVRILRKASPKTPIILVEERPYTNSWIKPTLLLENTQKCEAYRQAYKKLKKCGVKDLYYIPGESLFGDDSEASLDASHPSDLGFMRLAESLYPLLRKLCRKTS